ncbi:RIO1 family-domain-containing protein [Terfezia claveryi]|nr:RIO1 family-domain-containing protein [Terfezia claveryi]
MAAPKAIPVYTAGAQPQYEYDPNSGYIVPGQFDDAPPLQGEHAVPISSAASPPRPPTTTHHDPGHDGCHGDEFDYGDSDSDLFEDEMDDPDWASATGNLTKTYNRQRQLLASTAAPAPNLSSSAPLAPRTNPKPKANTSARVDDQIHSLSKFASRIKLDTLHSGLSSKSSSSNDKSDRATSEQVLDPRTRMILLQLINRSILHSLNGVLSTGKEANVYHALSDPSPSTITTTSPQPLHRAVKVYKTAILIFKDRDRYVTGEHRFRHGYNKSNPRSMVKIWAEKEMRNLKRLWAAGIPCPEPICLRLHVLVMGFIGDKRGWPAPRLKDAGIEDPEVFEGLYTDLLSYMRIMYHVCRLVHADLSEYNLLYHKSKLYIIDVSQSVEHDHPRSSEFLRMDIKNVTDYFKKQGVDVFSERTVFEFITSPTHGTTESEIKSVLVKMERDGTKVPGVEGAAEKEVQENVFRQVYIPRTLEEVYDIERDAAKVGRGEGQGLIYKDLLAVNNNEGEDGGGGVKLPPGSEEEGEEEEEEGAWEAEEEGGEEEEEEDELDENGNLIFKEKKPRGKKHEDKETKKAHKQKVKEEKREARKQKMPKHVKKKLVSSSSKK